MSEKTYQRTVTGREFENVRNKEERWNIIYAVLLIGGLGGGIRLLLDFPNDFFLGISWSWVCVMAIGGGANWFKEVIDRPRIKEVAFETITFFDNEFQNTYFRKTATYKYELYDNVRVEDDKLILHYKEPIVKNVNDYVIPYYKSFDDASEILAKFQEKIRTQD